MDRAMGEVFALIAPLRRGGLPRVTPVPCFVSLPGGAARQDSVLSHTIPFRAHHSGAGESALEEASWTRIFKVGYT